ncbi:unnamed protein product [Lactuca saligna]|uniref:Piwi domain-containing protein n=1 Tax=Lactuca saligna TaxID=75948 RepID=A0AA36A3Z8_LACSI|nr:unnamed protein product [Lactuca saligna]
MVTTVLCLHDHKSTLCEQSTVAEEAEGIQKTCLYTVSPSFVHATCLLDPSPSKLRFRLSGLALYLATYFMFVILLDAKGDYPRIKRVYETELGIISQCFQSKNVMNLHIQYFENVAMKINVKVGGRNTVLAATFSNRLYVPRLEDLSVMPVEQIGFGLQAIIYLLYQPL